MKAFTRKKYGGPEVLSLQEIDKPVLKDNQLLVRIKANSVNPADWHILRGKPFMARFVFGLLKPKYLIPGGDFSGIVEQVGKDVKDFKTGDNVFGESLKDGAFAEYMAVSHDVCGHMPASANFPEMACLPIAGLTALQALTTHGKLVPGETVLVNGSTGGVGHFVVQLAKLLGAKVTAVCSGKNVEFARTLGADNVIAYDVENIHKHTGKYDLVIDVQGNLTYNDYKRMGGRGVMIGFISMQHMMGVMLKKAINKFPLVQFTADANQKDLATLSDLIAEGKIKVYLDKTFSYKQIPEAIHYIEKMRTRGKVAMVWEENDGV